VIHLHAAKMGIITACNVFGTNINSLSFITMSAGCLSQVW